MGKGGSFDRRKKNACIITPCHSHIYFEYGMKYELGIIQKTSITQTIQFSGSIHILKHISSLLPQQPFRKFCFLATPHLSIKRSASVCIPRRRVPTLPATTKKLPQLPGSHTNAWGQSWESRWWIAGEIDTSETKNRTLCKLGLRINLPKSHMTSKMQRYSQKMFPFQLEKKIPPVPSDFSWEMVSIRWCFLRSLLWFTGKWDVSTRMFPVSLVILHGTTIMENGRQGYAGLKDKHMDLWWSLKQRWCELEPFYLKWYCAPYATYMFQKYSCKYHYNRISFPACI